MLNHNFSFSDKNDESDEENNDTNFITSSKLMGKRSKNGLEPEKKHSRYANWFTGGWSFPERSRATANYDCQ